MQKHLRLTLKKAVNDALTEYFFSAARIVFVSLVFIFLFISIFLSQNISSIYFRVMNEDYNSTVSMLRNIDKTKDYPYVLKINTNAFGIKLKDDVNQENLKRRERIKKLETILGKNKNARDVLLALSLLYKEEGNNLKSDEYLRRARALDPLLQ